MNVLYISSDCEGVTQSSLLLPSSLPVDGATALQETWTEAPGRSGRLLLPIGDFHGNKLEWNPPFFELNQEFSPLSQKIKKKRLCQQYKFICFRSFKLAKSLIEMKWIRDKNKKKVGSFPLERSFRALLSLGCFKFLNRINILTNESPHLSGAKEPVFLLWLFRLFSPWHSQVATSLDSVWQPVKCWLLHITDYKDGIWWKFDAAQL